MWEVIKLNKRVFKHKRFVGLLAAVVVIAAAYWAYNQISTYQNKRQFNEARKSIDNIYYKLVKYAGKPSKSQSDNRCSRSYNEFAGYGEVTCDVDRSFTYSVEDESHAQAIMKQIQKQASLNSVFSGPTRPLSSTLKDGYALGDEYHESQDIYKFETLVCTIKYVYDTPQDTFLNLDKNSSKSFYVVIACTGPAKKQYYPLN